MSKANVRTTVLGAVFIWLLALGLGVGLLLIPAYNAETQVSSQADLSIQKFVNNESPIVGETISFSFRVTNLGPDTFDGSINIDDFSEGPLREIQCGPGQSFFARGPASCPNVAGGSFRLLPGESALFGGTLPAVTPLEEGALTNTATLIASGTPDPNPDNNNDTITVRVEGANETPDVDEDGSLLPGDRQAGQPAESPTNIFAPSIDADQETDQDSGDVDQQMEGSPGGTQDANTGNFAVPYQDIN